MTPPTPIVPRQRPLPATGRLGVLSAYFTLYAVGGAAVTAGALVAALRPSFGWQTTPGKALLVAAGGALLTFGFVRTTRLLRRRQRTGVHLAAVCLATALASSVSARWDWLAIGIPIVGLILCASVWRHVD